MKSFIIAFIACLFLASCGKFADGTSVWGGGLWILPWITFIGTVIFGYMAYKSSKSGSTVVDKQTGRRIESNKNVPIYKTWPFLFAAILFAATIVIILMVNGDR